MAEKAAVNRERRSSRNLGCTWAFKILFLEFFHFSHTLVMEVNFGVELGNSFFQEPVLYKPFFGCWRFSHEQNRRVPAFVVLALQQGKGR